MSKCEKKKKNTARAFSIVSSSIFLFLEGLNFFKAVFAAPRFPLFSGLHLKRRKKK